MEIDQSNVKQTRLNGEVNRPIAFNETRIVTLNRFTFKYQSALFLIKISI